MDRKRQSTQLRASITLTTLLQSSLPVSPSHTFYFGCVIGARGSATAGTCSVNECGLADGGEVEGCEIILPLEQTAGALFGLD